MATTMKELCRNLNIKQNISTTYHPQMDGQSERTNQWLEQYLRIFGNGAQTDWAKWLPLTQYTHNAWPSAATGKSPFELIMGHIPYAHVGKTHSLAPAIDSRLAQTKAMRQAAQQAITHAQQITIRATKYKPFEEGQKVWLEATHLKTTHPTAKLSPRRYGPFEITKKISHVVYQLHIPQQWKIHDVFHAALLTPYKETEKHGPNYHDPPPDVIEGEPEWEVEQIVGARRFGRSRRLQYQVRWTGYSDAHDTWETADDVHAPQLAAEFWKGNQVLAKRIAYKPTTNKEEETNSLSISLMTTHGSDHTHQRHAHAHRSGVASDEERPHSPPSDNEGSNTEPGLDRGRPILQYRPPTPYAPPHFAHRNSRCGLTLERDAGDDPARVRDGWTVAADGGLCSPNGKVWHPRLFGDRYAISTVDEDGALGTTPYVRYAINPEGDPTVYGIFQREGIIHSKPLKALASHRLASSREGHLDWLDGRFALRALIDVELRDLDDVGVEADVYRLRKAAFDKKDLEERDRELSRDWARWYHAKERVHNRLVKARVRTCLYDAFKDNRAVPRWLQQGRNGPGPNYVFEGPRYVNQTRRPHRPDDDQTLVPTPITRTNPLPPNPPTPDESHHRDTDPSPPPPRTTSTRAQAGGIRKNKGKQCGRPAHLLVLPEVFVTPEPHRGIVPQVLKDQAKANEADKARRAQRDRDESPSWGDLPDDWDFDHYDNWDVSHGTD